MKRLLLLLLWLSQSLFVAAEMDITRVDIVATLDTPAAVDLASNVQRALQQANLGIDTAVYDSAKYQSDKASTTLIITLGDSSLAWLNNPNNNFATALAFHVNSLLFRQQKFSEQRISALYRDQPLLRQLHLTKLLLPNAQRVAVLRGAHELVPNAATLQRESRLAIDEIAVENQPDWLKLLSLSLRDSDALLGIDDPAIYNSDTIRSILLTAYRHGKGVIGPSRAFVNAGSLASCHTSQEQYLQQLVDMVTTTVHQHHLPRPQYPNAFNVIVNKQVAISLNLVIPDENTLSARLQEQNGECGNGC